MECANWQKGRSLPEFYTLSPTLVCRFRSTTLFQGFCRGRKDRPVKRLNAKGVAETPGSNEESLT